MLMVCLVLCGCSNKPPYKAPVSDLTDKTTKVSVKSVAKKAAEVYNQPKAIQPSVAQSYGRKYAPLQIAPSGSLSWRWPTTGNVIAKFSSEKAKNGIDISGKNGQAVIAAAPGVVVYVGSGLRGYGQMVILKHNEQFLSAYAHNSRILVKEGDVVKANSKIAEMGQTDTDSVRLHFEIRKNGQPVDPVLYLPKRVS